jgi:hypothetical protein
VRYLSDDIFFEIDDDFDEDFVEVKRAPAPVSIGGISTPAEPIDYRGAVELTGDAEKLFDFSNTKLSPIQQLYIIGYATKGTKKGACQLAGVPFYVVNKWMDNEEFSNALQNAVEIVRASLEEELLRRAMNGSDRLLLEAVKASKPEKYNKKQADINVNGTMVHTWADLAKQVNAMPAHGAIEGDVVEED